MMQQTYLQDPATGNLEFLEHFAAPGRIGLAGGTHVIDRSIRRLQGPLKADEGGCLWSHAFLCSGIRLDEQHWVLESDLEIHRKQIRLGVQENRASKYSDAKAYPNLAILDFGLDPDQTRRVMTEGLDLLAGLARYSLRELLGTLLAIKRPTLRSRENLLAREGTLYCSAMVQHCYAQAGVEFAQGISLKNTTPQDIAATSVPHTAYLLVREGRPPAGSI